MFTRMRVAIAGALVSLAVAASCALSAPNRASAEAMPDARRAPSTAAKIAAVTVENTAGPNRDCWWVRVGKSESVAVWVSPRLAGEVGGGFRFVNLFFHDPTCIRPIALFGSVARSSGSEPLSIGNASLEFAVAPVAGKTWADVVVRDDLDVKLERH